MQPQKSSKPHVRFETKPGQQLQVDWKENLKITTVHGEAIEFNIMTSTLGYSREHIFIYTKGKTTEDFLRCIIDTPVSYTHLDVYKRQIDRTEYEIKYDMGYAYGFYFSQPRDMIKDNLEKCDDDHYDFRLMSSNQ